MDTQMSLYQPGGAGDLVPSAAVDVLDLVQQTEQSVLPLQRQMEATIAERAQEIDQLKARMTSLTTQLQHNAAINASQLSALQQTVSQQDAEIRQFQMTLWECEQSIKNLSTKDMSDVYRRIQSHTTVIERFNNGLIRKWIPYDFDIIARLQRQGYPVPPHLK